MFVQNKEPFKTKPQKERVISIPFQKNEITLETREAYDNLIKIPISELAYFIVDIMSHRLIIELEWYNEFIKAKTELYEKIPDNRLNENHALILAFHRLLCGIIGVEYDLKSYIEQIGQKKYEECNNRNETLADYFLNLLLGNEINEDKEDPCYKIIENQHQIYIHLGKAIMAIEKKGLPLKVQLKDLQASLQDHPSFIKSNAGRQLGGTYTKVWIFDLQKIVEEV
jgi:hypothetical protein